MKIWILCLVLISNLALGQNKDELKIGISQEFETLNPMLAGTGGAVYMLRFIYRDGIYLDAKNQWKTHWVKEIPDFKNKKAKFITVKGKKFLETNWEILEKAKWGDGTPLTCKDIHLSWQVGLSENVKIDNRQPYTEIESITWDPKTPKKCKIVFNNPHWDYYGYLAGHGNLSPLPAHLEEEVFNKYKGQAEGYDRNTLYTKNPTLPGLWLGPYLLKEVGLGSHLIMEANPLFYGKQPNIKKVIIRIIPNASTLEANLRSKTVDKLTDVQGLTFDQGLAFEQKIKNENLPYDIYFKAGTVYQHIDLNLDNPILKDLKVRQALSHGMKKDEIMKSIYENKAGDAIHPLTMEDPWFTKDPKVVTVYKYDRRKAAQLLEEAGWKLGPDGYRYKDGKKLSLLMVAAAGLKLIENMQAILQSQWKAIGVDLLIKNEPGRVLFSETLPKRKFDLALFSWSSSIENVPESVFHSKNIPTEKNTWSGQNYPGWNNKKVDEAIEKLKIEFDPKKRVQLSHQIIREYTSDIPVIPLFFRPDVGVVPKGFKNYVPTGHQFYDSNNCEDWAY